MVIAFIDQGTTDEFTVVQRFNQGTIPKTGCNRFRPDRDRDFFVTFLEKQKSKIVNLEIFQRIMVLSK